MTKRADRSCCCTDRTPGPPSSFGCSTPPGSRRAATAIRWRLQVRDAIIADLVAEIVDVLRDGSTVRPEPGGAARAVSPGDIAVLVRANSQAEAVRAALLAAGVPSVLQARTNVFATRAATDWLALLEALEQPHRAGVVRRLALSAFVGADARTLLGWGDAGHDALAQQVRAWGAVLRRDGVAALFAAVDAEHRSTARLLGHTGGERLATDLRHIGDVLHTVATTESLGPAALLTWLRRRVQESDRLDPTAERSRRLDSDARAVQVVTVHMSKGLEFPLVYVPFAGNRWVEEPTVALFHDATGRADPRRRRLDRRGLEGVGRRAPTGGRRGGPAPALRRGDPRSFGVDVVVGALDHDPRLGAEPPAVRGPRGVAGPAARRRHGRPPRHESGPRAPAVGWRSPG